MSALIIALTPFALNALMTFVKWAGADAMSKPWKRFLLAVFALAGVFAANVMNGTPIDVNQVSALWTMAVEAFIAFIAAHGSYTLFFAKKTV